MMKNISNGIIRMIVVGSLMFAALFISLVAQAQEKPVKNIVLVHGAFVDGSGWRSVYEILESRGYIVSVVQEPLVSFEGDLSTVQRTLDALNGPCILVGHSYGGGLITEAGNDSHVAGLVYIAAHAPDKGESEADNGKRMPPAYKSLVKAANGFDHIDPAHFPADFAGGVPKKLADFMAISQTHTADQVFHAVIQNPAWRTKPSWYMVAKSDRIINPDLERMYAERAGSRKVEIDGASHSVFITHPKEVAELIMEAAKGSIK